MSLPAWQQRVLDRMEGALQASEPHLASMFAIFARLNAGEPVGAEPRARARPRPRRRRMPAGTAIYAVLLVPLMVMTVVGVVLGSGSSAKACEAGYSVGGTSPLMGRSACQAPANETAGKTAAGTTVAGTTVAGKTVAGKPASSPGGRSCIAAEQSVQPAAWTGSELAFSPPAETNAASGDPSGMC
jgi:Protein of unknown function (DUF3040)